MEQTKGLLLDTKQIKILLRGPLEHPAAATFRSHIPDKPNSSIQPYRLTPLGKTVLARQARDQS